MYFIRRLEREDLPEAQRLRAEIYLQQGFLTPDDLTADGRDEDEFDAHSVHFSAFDVTGSMVGTIRMILPEVELPIRSYFGIETGDGIEVSRFVIAPDHRGVPTALGLCRAVCAHVEALGLDMMYAVMEEELTANLRWLGFPFETLAGPIEVMNTPNHALVCSRTAVLAEMERHDAGRPYPKAAPYFARPFEDGAGVSKADFQA